MQLTEKKLKRSAFSYAGHRSYQIVESAKKEVKDALKTTFLQKLLPWTAPKVRVEPTQYQIYAGPLKGGDKKLMDILPGQDPNSLTPEMLGIVEAQWQPNPQLTVYDAQSKSALTAAEAIGKRKSNVRWMPQYFVNPLQSYDYLVYESLVKNTLIGPVMATLMRFIMGTGFHPELELRNPSGDEKKDAATLEAGQEIISALESVDRQVTEKSNTEGIDISFEQKITNMIHNMLVYNRSAGLFVYDKDNPIEINGKPYTDIPVNIVDFHPRDIGMVKISPESHKMVSVQINQVSGFVNTDEMIYFWNSDAASAIYNAKYYGGSMLMPMIAPARLIQKQLQNILPSISNNMAAGLYHMYVQPQGGTKTQKEAEYASITQANVMGTSSVFMIDPERVQYEAVNYDPKVSELLAMFEMMVKYILALANVPQIGFYDEAAANHATAVEKIQLTISTVINPRRAGIGDDIARQWYNPNFKILYKDKEKFLETYRIKVAFEDLQVETLKERAEGLEILERRAPLTHEKAEEILQIDGYQDSIDPDREAVPAREEFEVEQEGKKSIVKSKT